MIYIGADHGGFELKEKVKAWLGEWGYQYQDLGALKLDPEDDYPDFAFKVAEKISQDEDITKAWKERPKGILICRSAGGITIAANKVCGVRALPIYDQKQAKHAREHNDANVIGISGDWTNEKDAQAMIKVFLETEFSAEDRHQRRINMISEFESKQCGCSCEEGGNGGCSC